MPTSDPYALPPPAVGAGVRQVATVQLNDGTTNVDSQLITVVDPSTWAAQQAVKNTPPAGNEYGAVVRSIQAGCGESVVSAQVSVGNAATQVTAASPNAYRRKVRVKPLFSNIWIGPSGVTVGNGYHVSDGESVELELGPGLALYAIAPSGATATVHVLELG